MQYLLSLGPTTSSDMGAFVLPGSPDLQDAAASDTVESLNPWTMYDAFLALHREGKIKHRLRIFFLTQDRRPDVLLLKQRLLNSFPDFGDDMVKISGIGEFAAAWNFRGGATSAKYETALKLVAEHGFAFQQHTLSLNEDQFTTSTFEKVNAATPIANLLWAIGHVPKIDGPTLDRLKAIGAGVAVHGRLYLSGTPANGGPPYRKIVDTGIHVGAGSDAAAVSVFDPWLIIYYMVTGKNSAGEMVNPGQQLIRTEALRLCTAENGWYTRSAPSRPANSAISRCSATTTSIREGVRRRHQTSEIDDDRRRRQGGLPEQRLAVSGSTRIVFGGRPRREFLVSRRLPGARLHFETNGTFGARKDCVPHSRRNIDAPQTPFGCF